MNDKNRSYALKARVVRFKEEVFDPLKLVSKGDANRSIKDDRCYGARPEGNITTRYI